MELRVLLSRAGELSAGQQRRVAAIVGSLVADAAGKPTPQLIIPRIIPRVKYVCSYAKRYVVDGCYRRFRRSS